MSIMLTVFATYVPGYYDGPTGNGYARMGVQHLPDSLCRSLGSRPRMAPSRIIQVAEDLDDPGHSPRHPIPTRPWQGSPPERRRQCRPTGPPVPTRVARLLDLGLAGYPATKTMNGNPVPVAPFQYVDSHDHSCFPHEFLRKSRGVRLIAAKWFKLRPYAVALYTAQGVPMLWQGQELAENYTIPDSGEDRIEYREEEEAMPTLGTNLYLHGT